jgi:thioredoxin-related protein
MGGIVLILLCCTPNHYPVVTVRPASCSDDVQFAQTQSLGALLQFADKMHKPVFMNFYSPWIESCRRMDEQVFTQDALASYFNTHFINYKVNISLPSQGQEIADLYGVNLYPTMLFVDGKGKIMMRHEGAASASQLLEMGSYLHKAVEKEMISVTMNSN